jgi:hypothetical protein
MLSGFDRGVASETTVCVCTALLLCAAPAAAGPPFAVDDPGTVEAYKGTFLLRYELVRDRDVNLHSVPAATLTLGLPGKLELALDGAILKSEAAEAPSAGVGDLGLSFKWRFLEQDETVPAVAMAYALRLPTGKDGLSGEATVHSPYLALGWQLDERWQLFGDLGVNVRDRGGDHPQLFAGGALGYQALESWLIGVDLLGHTHVSEVQRSDLSIGVATQLDLSECWTLMARVGRSLSGTQDVNTFAGIQLNF